MLLQELEQVGVGRLLRIGLPAHMNSRGGLSCQCLIRRGDSDKIAIVNYGYSGEFFRFAGVNRRQRCAESIRAHNFSMEQAWELLIDRIVVPAGHEGSAIDFGRGLSG